MLDRLDAFVERVFVIALEDGHGLLGQDRPVVDLDGGDVDRAAGHLHAGGEGLGHGVGAPERRQQAGMGVDDPVGEGGEHRLGQHGHEPCHGHEIHVVGPQRLDDRSGEGDPVGQVFRPVHHGRRDAGGGGPVQGGHAGPVGDDDRHRQAGVDDRLQIGPAPRGQHS